MTAYCKHCCICHKEAEVIIVGYLRQGMRDRQGTDEDIQMNRHEVEKRIISKLSCVVKHITN